jgi:cytosine/adenosine deaminase-related metal-dependent hydrolase
MDNTGSGTGLPRSSSVNVSRRALMRSAAAMLAATAVAGIARPAFAQRGPVRTLLKGGVVLSFDPAVGDFEKGDVLIEDKKIVAVRPDISADAAVIDASRMIVLPGDAGIRPSLSSDVETTMAADMFTQMRSVFTLQRALLNDRSIRGEKDLPPLLNARDVIEFATLQGARADGMEAKVGTLTPGKEADIVMLRTDLPNTLPFNNAYGAVVTAMDTSNVDTVMVAGKAVKRAGKLVGVDLERVGREAAASRVYLVGKLGWPRSVIDTSLSGH